MIVQGECFRVTIFLCLTSFSVTRACMPWYMMLSPGTPATCRLLFMDLQDTLKSLLQLPGGLYDLCRVVWGVRSCEPQGVLAIRFGLLGCPQEHGMVLGLIVFVDERGREEGLLTHARIYLVE